MTTETEVLQALQTAVIAAVAASSMPALPIKAIGRTLSPPNDQKYLEIVHIPNNPTDEFWNEERNFRGFLRLILHWPADDAGAYPATTVRDSVASYFTKDRVAGPIKFYDHPSSMQAIGAGQEQLFPLTVPYRCFSPS